MFRWLKPSMVVGASGWRAAFRAAQVFTEEWEQVVLKTVRRPSGGSELGAPKEEGVRRFFAGRSGIRGRPHQSFGRAALSNFTPDERFDPVPYERVVLDLDMRLHEGPGVPRVSGA